MLPVVNEAPTRGVRIARACYAIVGSLAGLAIVSAFVPGLRPSQELLTLGLCAIAGMAAFEGRRRMDGVLLRFARAHGAVSALPSEQSVPIA